MEAFGEADSKPTNRIPYIVYWLTILSRAAFK